MNYHGLLGLLQSYEHDHQLNKGVVNLVGGPVTGHHRCFGKEKNKNKIKKVQYASPSQVIKKNKTKKN